MDLRDKVIVVNVPTVQVVEPKNGIMTRKEVQEKLAVEFARVSNEL